MSEQITSRLLIAERAEAAAKLLAQGLSVPNPYPEGSTAALEWEATVTRLLVDGVDIEASA